MGSQFVEAVNQMSGCMGYTVLFRARSKCVCCIYHLCISHYKLSTCTNTPHWGLTKKSRYKEGGPLPVWQSTTPAGHNSSSSRDFVCIALTAQSHICDVLCKKDFY